MVGCQNVGPLLAPSSSAVLSFIGDHKGTIILTTSL